MTKNFNNFIMIPNFNKVLLILNIYFLFIKYLKNKTFYFIKINRDNNLNFNYKIIKIKNSKKNTKKQLLIQKKKLKNINI